VTCHTPPGGPGGTLDDSMLLAGGLRVSAGPYGDFYSANLTSDRETGLGGWTDDEIKRGITTGTTRDGRRSLPFVMPYTARANMSPEDLDALVAYLRSLPPVYNKIPEHEPPGPLTYLWGKFKMLILHEEMTITFHSGNAGATGAGGADPGAATHKGGQQ
jgi:hypothetical protein